MPISVDAAHREESYEPVFVARQPIFDLKMRVWGYELLFRNSSDVNSAFIADSSTATANVIIDGIVQAREGIPPDKVLLINFSRELLLDDTPLLLPENCGIELLEDIEPEPGIVERLKQIGEYRMLVVDDFTGRRGGYDQILDLAHLVKVDVLHMDDAQIGSAVDYLIPFRSILLAEKVETKDIFNMSARLGFTLFQGFFFSRPEIVHGRKLSSVQLSRLRLIEEIEQQVFDPDKIAGVIESDVSLSYRLIRYINSPGLGLLTQIRSIRHAIAILGENLIKQWLRILIMVDLNSTDRGLEILRLSSMRARLMHLIADSRPSPMSPDSMFLIGLFSGLDALLDQPMENILQELPLDNMIKKTLMGEEKETGRYLELAMAVEKGDWTKLYRLSCELELKIDLIARLHMETIKWGNAFLLPPAPADN